MCHCSKQDLNGRLGGSLALAPSILVQSPEQFIGRLKVDNPSRLGKSQPMRAAILVLAFLPFVYYGARDTAFHFRGRKVTRTEHILHAAIGLVLAIMFSHALMAHHLIVLAALVLFVVTGSVDEYIFHRGIPEEESNLHAKEHLALLIFIVVSLGTDWLEQNHWSLSHALMQLHRTPGGAT
jgi:protein-S-isoprenylcysteine O-methyltransferase Ste14